MKVKTWHLFLVIIILFGCSFYIVNLKFDKFYRLNGINNDNRVLIDKYLDEEEQAYLVENQIPIDLFIDYIEEDDFHLQNYQYYNDLKNSNRYKKMSDILDMGNSLSTRLNYLFHGQAEKKAKDLIDRNLEKAFLSEENFQFDYIDIYTDLLPLYAQNDYSFVQDTEFYIEQLHILGIKDLSDVKEKIKMMTTGYSQKAMKSLFEQTHLQESQIIFNPYELSTVVDKQHYIGLYEPNGLLLVQDVPRVRYAMYLQSDAYSALSKMYQDLNKTYSGFILREAYIGPEALNEEAGYNEFQLGLTIQVAKSQVAYKDFQDTDISKWLQQHAHEYGFILRYPKNKASITNHSYDAHTYRYVGKALAISLYESNLTLEEYQSQDR